MPGADFAAPSRQKCKGCELYDVTVSNSKGRGAAIEMSRDEVLTVFGPADSRRCFYCGIAEPAYVSMQIPNPSGKPGLRLGLDRLDSSRPYTTDNVVICCLVCNRLKSSTFKHPEMILLGKTVHSIWIARGLDARFPQAAGGS
ncbi:hypothetical protein GCM10009710_03640 [Aeromicrobium alkaliterrae]|uniref:HNH endonuclease n=1 Tax=Aeromicrobium alkaliterrae TaxID=302168 RepID=A0ABN2JGD6_9ACTN